MGAAALPIAMGAGSLVSGALGSHSANAAQNRAMGAYNSAAGRVNDFATGSLVPRGEQLYGQYGTQPLGQAQGYYGALLGQGGRTAMQAATAPAANNIRETYAGVKRSIQPGDRSGTAALQRAEADRASAGQISRLTAGVQGGAAQALGNLGQFGVGAGLGALSNAGSLYAGNVAPAAGLASQAVGQNAATQGGIGQGLGGILQSFASRPKPSQTGPAGTAAAPAAGGGTGRPK